jgi:hypothetical protein
MPLGKLQKDMHLGEGLPIGAARDLAGGCSGHKIRSKSMKCIDWKNIANACTTIDSGG